VSKLSNIQKIRRAAVPHPARCPRTCARARGDRGAPRLLSYGSGAAETRRTQKGVPRRSRPAPASGAGLGPGSICKTHPRDPFGPPRPTTSSRPGPARDRGEDAPRPPSSSASPWTTSRAPWPHRSRWDRHTSDRGPAICREAPSFRASYPVEPGGLEPPTPCLQSEISGTGNPRKSSNHATDRVILPDSQVTVQAVWGG